jgi:two-component system sensor histidine kinase DctS
MASSVTRLANPPEFPALGKGMRRALPAVIALLLAAATAGLFALSNTQERNEAGEQVLSDTLLARESIRFQVGRESEALQKLAADVGRGKLSDETVQGQLQTFLRRAGQVEGLFVVDSEFKPRLWAQRPGSQDVLGQMPIELLESAATKARTQERPVFTAVFQALHGPSVGLIVPTPEAVPGKFLVAIYSLDRLLEEMVPWHLAQDYEFSLSDVTRTQSARRAALRPGRGVYTHQEALELGDTTLLLGANSIKGAPGWIANALRAGVATLAILLLWSLWALWRDHQHRAAAERLATEEAAFRKAMGDCSVIGLSARDMEGRVTYVNPAFCRMMGYRDDELLGRSPSDHGWLPPLDSNYRNHLEQSIHANALQPAFETTLFRCDGQALAAAVYDAPLLDSHGAQVGWTSSIVDLTQQKQIEERERIQQERLQTAARLTTMGELTSSLAHELNQPLGAIASYLAGSLKMLRQGDDDRAELIATLARASEQTQRAGLVIKRIHEFVRKHQPSHVPVQLAHIVEACRALIELQARREAVRVEISSSSALETPIRGDPILLQQVILNLTRNAIDAMSQSAPDRRRLSIGAIADSAGVTLTIRDFGGGIAAEDVERIFLPFFTTKVEGMGMGLSICRTIVQTHGGRLWFERFPDGTAFNLWLAIAQ